MRGQRPALIICALLLVTQSGGYYLPAFTDQGRFGDVSAQVELRLVSGSGGSSGCLMVRANPNGDSD